jgi:rhodanese-related sulfurtransferase
LSANHEAQLIDVREPTEWAATGVPPGAVLIPLAEVEGRAPAELVSDRPVYVICKSGTRSRQAAETLIRLGFTEVYNVDGGIQAWLQAGLPVETYKP